MANGVGGRIKEKKTIEFIWKSKVTHNHMKDITYQKFVCTERPEKAESNFTRFMVGGSDELLQ